MFFIAACDSTAPDVGNPDPPDDTPDPGPVPVESSSFIRITIDDRWITIDSTGNVGRGFWDSPGGRAGFLYASGLWLAGEQDGMTRATLRARGTGNWKLSCPASQKSSASSSDCIYLLTENSDEVEWPEGAPRDLNGDPLVYGDIMTWSVYEPAAKVESWAPDLYANPLEDVTVEISAYMYEDLDNVFFVRYKFTNTGAKTVSDMFAGIQTDIDLESWGVDELRCMGAPDNVTGFDLDQNVSYTYPYGAMNNQPLANNCDVSVAGVTFLESPVAVSGKGAVSYHPIYRKNNYIDFEFSEIATTDPIVVHNFLQGLSYDGQPMVDSTSSQQTSYAFSGDPVTGTGWVDAPIDVRGLLSAGPFQLAQDDSYELTAVYALSSGDLLSDARTAMVSKIADIRDRPELWQF